MPANSNKPGTPASNNKASGRSARAAAASAARPRVIVRQLRASDHDEVAALQNASYGGGSAWTREQFQSQLAVFPEGQICVVLDGKVCATSSSMIVDRAEMRANHTYDEITDGSTIRTHDPEGDFLYGIDMCVHPGKRGLRLAHRLYDERKELIEQMGLRGMIIAGRMPNYHKHADKMSAEEYVRRVTHKELRDPVVTAQVANGFHIIGLLKNYLPSDNESRGWAVLMEWHSPNYVPESLRKAGTGIVRVADVQYQMRTVTSFEEFCTQCEFFIDTAGDYNCDFLLFPELLTNQLLSLVPDERPGLSARQLDQFTQRYIEFFTSMAIKYDVNIIGGSHMTVGENDQLFNIAYLFRRDGSIATQKKVHITPSEARWWGVSAGDRFDVIDTDCGKIAILTCYDVEFPELSRIAASRGAQLFFTPFNTDIRPAYLRVRSCAQARAIENHVYVIISGCVGNLPMVEGADIHYAQSCILTPSDISFARDGIAAEATPNVETMLVHDLDLDVLRRTRTTGAVRTWHDRRLDLYQVRYSHDGADSSA